MAGTFDLPCQRMSSAPSTTGREAIQHNKICQSPQFRKRSRCRGYQAGLVKAFLSNEDDLGTRGQQHPRTPVSKLPWMASVVAIIEGASLGLPPPSHAVESVNVEFLSSFLDNVEHLGPYGPIFFVAVMVGAEMVPLFPTQPLTIASGLLFGGPKGALLAVIGTSTAAMLAFQLSRKLGKKMAEKAAAEELSEEQRESGIFTRVQNAIESGSIQQQVVAVTLLRLTPVVPFSATNYLLGATPIQFPAYVAGSMAGLTFWCSIYATLGAAGRELLKGGLSLDVLFEELLSKAGSYTEDAAIVMGIAGLSVLAYTKFGPQAESCDDKHDEQKERRT